MKKLAMILFAATLFISFTACSGSKKESAPETVVEETIEEIVEETPAYVEPTPEEALKAFTEFSKEYVDAFNNLAKDPQKFTTMSSQLQGKMADMERLRVNFTEKQLDQYKKALDLITQVNSAGKK